MLALADAGFDYLFNSVKWWDFESPWLLDQYEKFRHIAPSIGFPGKPRHRAAGRPNCWPPGFPEAEIEARYRQAYAFAAAFSTGVMMPMGFEFGWSRRLDVVPNGEDETPSRSASICSAFIAEVNRDEGGDPGAERGGAAAAADAARTTRCVVLLRQTESGDERALDRWSTRRSARRARVVPGCSSAAGLGQHRRARRCSTSCCRVAASAGARRGSVSSRSKCSVLRAAPRPMRAVPIAPCADVGRDPGITRQWRPDARILIENVYPEIDGGRFPVKRVVGDDGRGLGRYLPRRARQDRARCSNTRFEDEEWRETPFAFFDNDRWVARFRPDRVGRWRYTIEAWTDRFESWRDGSDQKARGRPGDRARTRRRPSGSSSRRCSSAAPTKTPRLTRDRSRNSTRPTTAAARRADASRRVARG